MKPADEYAIPTGWRSSLELPPNGARVVAVYGDGSGSSILVWLDGGFIDADGDFAWDEEHFQDVYSMWTPLPVGFRLWCEERENDPVTLPPPTTFLPPKRLDQSVERILRERAQWLGEPQPTVVRGIAIAAMCAAADLESKGFHALGEVAELREENERLRAELERGA